MASTQHIRIPRSARYCSAGHPEADHWIYLLHGYGQLAPRFLSKFEEIESPERFLIAPEGLHRFYVEGHSGRVGASWMTKEDRETDISDYIYYLNALHQQLQATGSRPKRITVLGFSQGVATAFRWIAAGRIAPDQFLICSGVLPPDLDLELDAAAFANMELHYITGDADPFRNAEEVNGAIARLKAYGIECPSHSFTGGHRVDLPSVLRLLRD